MYFSSQTLQIVEQPHTDKTLKPSKTQNTIYSVPKNISYSAENKIFINNKHTSKSEKC